MKLTILRSNLLTALSRVLPLTKTKSTMPILSCVLIRAAELQPVTLAATNLQQSVTTRAPADVAIAGVACVDAKALAERVKTFPEGPITVTLDASHLHLAAGKRKHKLPIVDPAEFPPLAPPATDGMTLPASSLATALDQTAPAASEDPDRPAIHGVYLEFVPDELRATATDGRRVHFAAQPAPGSRAQQAFILPLGSAEPILTMLCETVTLGMSGFELSVRSGDTALTTKLIDGHFPPVREFLSRMPSEGLTLDPSVLAAALASVALGSSSPGGSGIVTFTVVETELRISAGEAEDLLPLTPPYPSVSPPPVSVSAPFLSASLRHHGAPVSLRLPSSPTDPIYVTSAVPGPHSPVAIVMPCRN